MRLSGGKGQVIARAGTTEYLASRAIVTLPLGVLKSGSVAFSPALPEKQNAMSFLEMGPVIRVSLCFQEKFWEHDPKMADLSFLFTDDPQFPTWWTSQSSYLIRSLQAGQRAQTRRRIRAGAKMKSSPAQCSRWRGS